LKDSHIDPTVDRFEIVEREEPAVRASDLTIFNHQTSSGTPRNQTRAFKKILTFPENGTLRRFNNGLKMPMKTAMVVFRRKEGWTENRSSGHDRP
jgi:hypothetical protein